MVFKMTKVAVRALEEIGSSNWRDGSSGIF